MYRANSLSLRIAAALTFAWVTVATSQEPTDQNQQRAVIDYLSQVKPLLAEKCYSCHGRLKQEAGLRLETRELMITGGDSGAVVSVGDPGQSLLLQRVSSRDGEQMPPHGEGSPLKADQINLIREWILQGCKAPPEVIPTSPSDHWAFQPIERPKWMTASSETRPTIDKTANPIDTLLAHKRATKQIQTVAPAPRTLLLRRLYLDLIGLPPTHTQLRDQRPLSVIIEELLTNPQHGERWARHWMDVWRYSDWYGLGNQLRYSQKHIWHWRDWIVNSLNKDKGYDRMITEMLAGDEAWPTDQEAVTGTGFLARNYYLFNRTTWLDSTIEHTSKAFLGLTMNCAKCHDHKYDPITQLDYYRLRAIFEPHQIRLDAVPGETDFDKAGLPRAFDDHIDQITYLHRRGDPKSPDETSVIAPGVPAVLASFAPAIEPIQLPLAAHSPGTRPYVVRDHLAKATEQVLTARTKLEDTKKKRDELAAKPPESTTDTPPLAFQFHDDFDTLDANTWRLTGKDWKHSAGVLRQTTATREQQSAKLLVDLPRDFELRCQYTTTGGTTYKSVTIRFDQSEGTGYSNFVYTSAHAPDPKVQVAFERDKQSTYPGEGRKSFPIAVGKRYELRFAIRDTLVNVWLNDEFMTAFRYPNRRDGFLSLSGFDATVDFDSIQISDLKSSVELRQAGKQSIVSVDEAEQAVDVADAEYTLAIAHEALLQAVLEKEQAEANPAIDAEKQAELATLTGQRQIEWEIADLKRKRASNPTDAKKLGTIDQMLVKAQDNLSRSKDEPIAYKPIRGSRKALESPAHKEQDYPATYSPVSTGRRLALAKWITSTQNPLTARVIVNHVWMRHFGQPIVESTFDFGLRSPEPLHSDVLDLLAWEFMNSGWSFQHLHRLIVSSETYALSATSKESEPATIAADPDNLYLWRMNSRRMESQVIRDSLLSLANELDPTLGGPSISPSPEARRRSIYFLHSRDQTDSFLDMFDNADILQCYRRSASIVPQQALALYNSRLAIEMSGKIARQINEQTKQDSRNGFIQSTFFLILGRHPSPSEATECERYFDEMTKLTEVSDEQQIRDRFVQAMLNHNDFITIR